MSTPLDKYFEHLDDCDAGFGDEGAITVFSRSRVGDTPLHWASINGETVVARLMLEAGADVDAVGEDNYTPLHEAISHNRIDVVKLLLNYGADTTIQNDVIPLDWMLEDRLEMLELFK